MPKERRATPKALALPSHPLWHAPPLDEAFPGPRAQELMGASSELAIAHWPWRSRFHITEEAGALLCELVGQTGMDVGTCVTAMSRLFDERDYGPKYLGVDLSSWRSRQEALCGFLGGLSRDETALLVLGDIDVGGPPPWDLGNESHSSRTEAGGPAQVRQCLVRLEGCEDCLEDGIGRQVDPVPLAQLAFHHPDVLLNADGAVSVCAMGRDAAFETMLVLRFAQCVRLTLLKIKSLCDLVGPMSATQIVEKAQQWRLQAGHSAGAGPEHATTAKPKLSKSAYRILKFIRSEPAMPTYDDIEYNLQMGRGTISKYCRELREHGYRTPGHDTETAPK